MSKIDILIESFVEGDYFILFLVIVLLLILILVLALIKTRQDYNELLKNNQEDDDNGIVEIKDEEDVMGELNALLTENKEDQIDKDKPLIKQVDIKNIKTYTEEVKDYQDLEEENAVISAEELEKKAKERLDALGSTENQEAIAKYEEEQEKKAIISYEQLVKNASNITLSYKEQEKKEKNAPEVKKVEVEQKEVTPSELYLEEEEFLKILKEFRINLE